MVMGEGKRKERGENGQVGRHEGKSRQRERETEAGERRRTGWKGKLGRKAAEKAAGVIADQETEGRRGKDRPHGRNGSRRSLSLPSPFTLSLLLLPRILLLHFRFHSALRCAAFLFVVFLLTGFTSSLHLVFCHIISSSI